MSIFQRKTDSSLLQKQLEELSGNGPSFIDPDEWRLTTDKDGEGTAVIRFLPADPRIDGALPFVKIFNHFFKVNGRVYAENCPSTISANGFDLCPACTQNKLNWDNDPTEKKDNAKKAGMSRKLSYWANVLIVNDTSVPENNGKIKKYRFGKTIFDMIMNKQKGDEKVDIEGYDVTNVFDGSDFILKCAQKSGFANYDNSSFKERGLLDKNIENEERQQEILDGLFDLREIVAQDKFKSQEELQKKFNELHTAGNSGNSASSDQFDKDLAAYSKSKASDKTESSTVDQAVKDVKDFDDEMNEIFG